MYAVSDDFLAAVATSNEMTCRVEVWDATQNRATLTGLVTTGQVTIDTRRQNRRTCSFTMTDPDGTYTPEDASSVLNPLSGNELRLWRGVMIDGEAEEVPLGVFRITKTVAKETGGELTIDGTDRSWRIQKATFTSVYTIAAGTAVEDAIAELLADRYPAILTAFPSTGAITPLVVLGSGNGGDDPWAAAQKLATDAGYDLYFDVTGRAVMLQTSSLYSTDPVIAYGPDDAKVILSAERQWDGEQACNGYIVTGEGSGVPVPVRAEAWDTDPTSPTYRYGPFGECPKTYSSPLIVSLGQAQAAADERLRRGLGIGGTLSWTQAVNPAHDGSDVVTVTRPALNVADVFVIDSMTIPLKAADSSPVTGRTRVLLTED